MAKVAIFRFTVEGRGAFPLDMLRHDRCYPASESAAIVAQDEAGLRFVELTHVATGETNAEVRYWTPTLGRWESFGWKVATVREVK